MKGFIFLGLCVSPLAIAQKTDSTQIQEIEAISFTKRLPVTKEIIKIKDLVQKNLAQDLPILLKNQTSVLSSSDTGNGVGYTDFRIRGVSGTAINVMLNGVPYNDSESMGSFFVNISDIAHSASQILIQRGVGTSTNGVAAFGASVNIITKNPEEKPYFSTDLSYGSFSTQRQAFELGTGKFLNNKFSLMARYSLTKSDGYIDRAFSDLKSYVITALFETPKTQIKFLTFGGKEKTYQAWNGVDNETYKTHRKRNFSGEIYQPDGSILYYDNETDNYRQNHYHLILNQRINDFWNLEATLHYTKGKGFYENYKKNQRPSKYNLNLGVARTNFIRQKWLDNDFYGAIAQIYGQFSGLKLHFGVAGNQYLGEHFGMVSSPLIAHQHEYYRNHSVKNDFSAFNKAMYRFGNVELFGDVQFRHITHTAEVLKQGDDEGGDFCKSFNFINPKAGINLHFHQGKAYFSYALAHREPHRDDILGKNDVKHETLHDFELGIEKNWQKISLFANAYFMNYRNQLVFNGKIDNVGAFLRENSGKSYRTGIELGVQAEIIKSLKINANANLSQNKNQNYILEKNGVLEHLGKTDIALSPQFIGNIGLNYQVTNFNFSLQNQYVSRQFLDNSQNEKLSIPSYSVLDFGASYQLNLKNHQLNIHFNLNNLLNKMYLNKGYVYDDTPYYFPQAGRNFMLGMTWKMF